MLGSGCKAPCRTDMALRRLRTGHFVLLWGANRHCFTDAGPEQLCSQDRHSTAPHGTSRISGLGCSGSFYRHTISYKTTRVASRAQGGVTISSSFSLCRGVASCGCSAPCRTDMASRLLRTWAFQVVAVCHTVSPACRMGTQDITG